MIAEVIAIGDELTSGQRVDTNSAWISRQLGELGIVVGYHTTVGDDLSRNVEIFRRAIERVDMVLVTGGLGPTADDLTRQAISEATGRRLIENAEALGHIERLFTSRHREMPERNRVQALFPEGSLIIDNPHGTAPGIDLLLEVANRDNSVITEGRTVRIFCLPGVPAEMFEMWHDSVTPRIMEFAGVRHVIVHHTLRCFGVGESHLESMLPDMIRRGRQPMVGITVHQATITLRITARAESAENCRLLIAPTERLIREQLGDLVYGSGDDELQDVVLRSLRQLGRTLAVAEVGTKGMLASMIAQSPEEVGVFRGGFVAGQSPLAMPLSSMRSSSAVSADDGQDVMTNLQRVAMCRQWADQVRELTGADWSLVTWLADEQIVIALATGEQVIDEIRSTGGHPDIVVPRAAKQALDFVRRYLISRNRAEDGSVRQA
ncbi:MAG: CinA family nicotinamide mononucleotide deamidase-related protein [Pirellulaceae bacterium]